MKNITKFILVLALITSFMLAYVALQANLLKISYCLEEKEKELADCYEQFKDLKFNVNKLSSLAFLEKQIAQEKMNFVLPKEFELIRYNQEWPQLNKVESLTARPRILDFLGWIKEAQAETDR